MTGFSLLLGHLVGDYIFQGDWQAMNKVNPFMLLPPGTTIPTEGGYIYRPASPEEEGAYRQALIGHLACTVHCVLYTLAVLLLTWAALPWWGYVACFVIHWPVDRFRLAKWWMETVSGQRGFANAPGLAPWSVIIVDNTFHLLTLYVLALLAGVAG